MVETIFTVVLVNMNFLTVSSFTEMEMIWKYYAPDKLMYQITTLAFIKVLAFHFQGSWLGYTLVEEMV